MKFYYQCADCNVMETREHENLEIVCPNNSEHGTMLEVSPLTNSELSDIYEEFLNEVYPDCKIAGYEYSTGYALKTIDPVAFRCGLSDWLDSEISEGIYIEHNGETFRKE